MSLNSKSIKQGNLSSEGLQTTAPEVPFCHHALHKKNYYVSVSNLLTFVEFIYPFIGTLV